MNLDIELIAIVALAVALDVLTGLAKGVKAGNVMSATMRDGLWHKVGYAAIIACACLVEYAQTVADFGFTVPVVVPVCAFIVLTEIASVIENVGELNPALKNTKLLQLFASSKADGAGKGE